MDISTIDSETMNIRDKFETIPQHLKTMSSEDPILTHYSTSQDLYFHEIDVCRALWMTSVVNNEKTMLQFANAIIIDGLEHMCETLLD